jgi:hypothetical protein
LRIKNDISERKPLVFRKFGNNLWTCVSNTGEALVLVSGACLIAAVQCAWRGESIMSKFLGMLLCGCVCLVLGFGSTGCTKKKDVKAETKMEPKMEPKKDSKMETKMDPKKEEPKKEAPKVETPKVEAPKVEAPKVETPKKAEEPKK